jgi:cytochrome c oxidase cbb3-type subunit 3
MNSDIATPRGTPKRTIWLWTALVAAGLLLSGGLVAAYQFRSAHLQELMLSTAPTEITRDPRLVGMAKAEGAPLYAAHCASCHGADMKGNTSLGAPNLLDETWLFGDGGVFDIERTILFGIRTGSNKSRDVTEMPALGQRGILTELQIRNVVEYLLRLNRRPHQEEAAAEGDRVFNGNAGCTYCHGGTGRGDPGSGATDLTVDVWNYGGDAKALYESIYFGRRGVCPGWFGVLSLEQIRALAVYIYAASHPED